MVSVGNFIFRPTTISLTFKSPTALLKGHTDNANTKLSIYFLFSTLETIRRENVASCYPRTTTYWKHFKLHFRFKYVKKPSSGAETESEDQEVCCDMVSQRCQRSHTHEVSSTGLPTQDLHKHNSDRQANMEEEVWGWRGPHPDRESRRNTLPQNTPVGNLIPSGHPWTHIHTNSIIWIEQVIFLAGHIFLCLGIHTHIHAH